ncbi:MAG TPA: TetR family transcriptional regulator [Pseudonocardia sp.]
MTEPIRAGTAKAERTREQIVTAAMRLFREQGYQGTTMRGVAAEAGVSVGNAYYYFASKEQLVQGYYDHMAAEQAARCQQLFANTSDFAERLHGSLLIWLEVAQPYHQFAGTFFATAAQPGNPLSPLSEASTPAREIMLAMYRELITGSSTRAGAELSEVLPELLWLYQLGVILYWVHDTSPDLARTHQLIEHTVPIIARLVRLSRLAVIRPLSRQAADLVTMLRSHHPAS